MLIFYQPALATLLAMLSLINHLISHGSPLSSVDDSCLEMMQFTRWGTQVVLWMRVFVVVSTIVVVLGAVNHQNQPAMEPW